MISLFFNRKTILVFVLSFLFLLFQTTAQDKIYLQDSKDKSKKEAIVILPGFGDSKKGRQAQIDFFKEKGYDIYIPDYLDRKSVNNCIRNFTNFYYEKDLNNYFKLHFFTYILGSWVLNDFILENDSNKIATIVYDRSPLQERAPYVASTKIPLLTKIFIGKVVRDLSKIDYQPIPKGNIKIGLLIESKATPLIRKFKKTTLAMGEVYWSPDSLNQAYDDFTYTRLHHKEMYVRFDVVGDQILHFIRNGKFSEAARREMFDWDPFVKFKE